MSSLVEIKQKISIEDLKEEEEAEEWAPSTTLSLYEESFLVCKPAPEFN